MQAEESTTRGVDGVEIAKMPEKSRTTRWLLLSALAFLLLAVPRNVVFAQGKDFADLTSTALLTPDAQLKGNDRCFKCHGDPQIIEFSPEALAGMVRPPVEGEPVMRSPEAVKRIFVPKESFLESVHGTTQCTECHQNIDLLPHGQKVITLSCDSCHENEVRDFDMGAHRPDTTDGQQRPTCATCHGSNAHAMESFKLPRSQKMAVAMVETCAACHGKAESRTLKMVESYREGAHGKGLFVKGLSSAPTCVDCHSRHSMLKSTDPESPVHPKNAPDTCGKCHEGVEDQFMESIHGQHLADDKQNAASCTICHRSHGIDNVDSPFLLGVVKECSTCHAKLAKTYLKSYHGKATVMNDPNAAVCSSCHGSHTIQPKKDPRSKVSDENVVATCETCHENVNENFTKYISHTDYTDPSKGPVVFYTWAIMMLLVLGTLGAFIPHSMLWFQRTLFQRFLNPMGHHLGDKRHKQRMVQRFRPVHRFTHFLIIISFMGLVATGFPLKYSHTQWAHELASLFGGIHAMGIIHRCLGLVSFLYCAIHIVFLIHFFVKECPRPIWKFLIGPDSMLFSLRDIKDAFAMMRWFLWLGPKPKLERWAYFEKFDYFGEIWGMFVIGTTGLMLWFPEQFTRILPGWVLNCATVIHSTEALLAASVIFLVHFFNTHIRPEKFPIDMVMLTGQMTEAEMQEERGDEYDRLVKEGKLEERIEKPVPFVYRFFGGIAGIGAFLFGIFLIVAALVAEVHQAKGLEMQDMVDAFLNIGNVIRDFF